MPRGPSSFPRGTRPAGRARASSVPFLLSLLFLLLASAPATTHAAVLVEIRVTASGYIAAPGVFRQFFATAVYSDGSQADITPVAEWTTSDSSIARVSREHASAGRVEARDPGVVEIRAALEFAGNKEKGFAPLVVYAGPIVEISTRPSSKNLDVGVAVPFRARATYASGYEGDVSDEVTWSSTNPTIASVAADGMVTPKRVGDVIIRARHTATGKQNSDADGAAKVKAKISYIDFAEEHHFPNETILGAGMAAQLGVYAHRVDGTRTNVTKDQEFQILFGGSDVADFTQGGEDAGLVTGLADGAVIVRTWDPERLLRSKNAILVRVSGVLSALEIEPNPFSVGVGDERTPKVYGRLSTGLSTPDLRKLVLWSIDQPQIASVGSSSGNYGKVTGRAVGETRLRAQEPITGMQSAPVRVAVGGAVVAVAVEPGEIVLGQGMKLPLAARGARSDGTRTTVTGNATWQISPASLAIVGEDGVLQALSSGSGTVRAVLNPGTAGEISSPAASLRIEGVLVGIRVTPAGFKVLRDQRRKASVEGDLSTGAVTSNLRDVVSWSVADQRVALVGDGSSPIPDEADPLGRGEVLGLEAGVTTLRAVEPTSGFASAEVDNLRVQGDIVAVEVDASNGGIVQIGYPGLYNALATFDDDSTGVVSDRCEWSIDDETVATVDNVLPGKGTITGLVIGGKTVVRIDCSGLQAYGTVHVAGDIVRLDISPEVFTGKALRERRFRAAADYQGGARGDATDLVEWSSDDPAVATVDNDENKGLVRFLSDGEAFIIAKAPSLHVAIATVTVTGGVESLRVISNSKTIRGSAGRKLKVIADLSDGDESIVTKEVVWTSSDEEVAYMSDREGEEGIVLGGTRVGRATITATLPTGHSGTTEITVDTVLDSMSMRPERRIVEVGRQRRVSARGHFENGENETMTRFVQFRSDDPAIADVESFGSTPGRVRGLSPGITAVRAVDPTTGIATGNATIIEVVEAE